MRSMAMWSKPQPGAATQHEVDSAKHDKRAPVSGATRYRTRTRSRSRSPKVNRLLNELEDLREQLVEDSYDKHEWEMEQLQREMDCMVMRAKEGVRQELQDRHTRELEARDHLIQLLKAEVAVLESKGVRVTPTSGDKSPTQAGKSGGASQGDKTVETLMFLPDVGCDCLPCLSLMGRMAMWRHTTAGCTSLCATPSWKVGLIIRSYFRSSGTSLEKLNECMMSLPAVRRAPLQQH